MENTIFLIILFSIIILIVVKISKKVKEVRNEVDKIKSENNVVEMIEAEFIEGIKGVNKGSFCYVIANEEGLAIVVRNSVNQKFNIKKEQILNFEIMTDNQIIEKQNFKNKNTIGRAVTGGILFGPLGAIVGAQSGGLKAVNKKEIKVNYYLIINYMNKNNDIEIISFKTYIAKHKIVEYINNMIKKDIVVEL